MRSWHIELTDPRSDSRTKKTHDATATKLGMKERGTIEETLAAYVRGEDGRKPHDQGMRIDPVLAAIAKHDGIVPLRLLRARHLGLGFAVSLLDDETNDVTLFNDDYAPDIGGHCFVVPGLTYSSSLVDDPVMTLMHDEFGTVPHTLRAALAGRPLSTLVEIPGLDRQPMILKVDESVGHDRLTIERLPSIPCGE